MYFPILINWTSLFPILGLLGGIFHFFFNFKRNFCLQTVENLHDQTLRFVASDLVLQCLQMSHKKDTRLNWVKLPYLNRVFLYINMYTYCTISARPACKLAGCSDSFLPIHFKLCRCLIV